MPSSPLRELISRSARQPRRILPQALRTVRSSGPSPHPPCTGAHRTEPALSIKRLRHGLRPLPSAREICWYKGGELTKGSTKYDTTPAGTVTSTQDATTHLLRPASLRSARSGHGAQREYFLQLVRVSVHLQSGSVKNRGQIFRPARRALLDSGSEAFLRRRPQTADGSLTSSAPRTCAVAIGGWASDPRC